MGKKYFCDYCNRTFADGAENRKKHLESTHHKKLRSAHYHMFRDPAEILKEESMKRPCRVFFQGGRCDYGSNCKFTHYSEEDFKNIHASILQAKQSKSSECIVSEEDFKAWTDKVSKKRKKPTPSESKFTIEPNFVLPETLKNIPNLPPSLLPYVQSTATKINVAEWGV